MHGQKIRFSKSFSKNFSKRYRGQTNSINRITKAIKLFKSGIRDNPINDHPLEGAKADLRSFSAGGDIRIIYRETEQAYEFLDIGSHNQVY